MGVKLLIYRIIFGALWFGLLIAAIGSIENIVKHTSIAEEKKRDIANIFLFLFESVVVYMLFFEL